MFDNLFLCVGAAKSGTTWLFSILKNHPDIHFSVEKELHYFAHAYTHRKPLSDEARLLRVKQRFGGIDPERQNKKTTQAELKWFNDYLSDPVDADWYIRMFAQRDCQQYCTDFSNLHCLLDQSGWEIVRNSAGNLKVLYVMRDPIKRLWSHIKFHLLINNESNKMSSWGRDDYVSFARQPFIWEHSDYANTIRTLQRALEPQQLMISFYDDIHKRRRQWLRELEGFLGVQSIEYPRDKLDKWVNKSNDEPMPPFFPSLFAEDMLQQIDCLEDLGYTVPEQWRKHY